MAPILQQAGETDETADRRALTIFYVLSAILVVVFFGFGLFYGRGTHLTIADYWRWFVVHIWVESIFEFFGVGRDLALPGHAGAGVRQVRPARGVPDGDPRLHQRHSGHGPPLLLVRRPEFLAGHRRRVQLAGADPADPAGGPRVDGVQVDQAPKAGSSPIAGRSISSRPAACGTSSARACSASSSTCRSSTTTSTPPT